MGRWWDGLPGREDGWRGLWGRAEAWRPRRPGRRAGTAPPHTVLSGAHGAGGGARLVPTEARHVGGLRRTELTSGLDADLVAMYEKQRAKGGPGAGLLQGKRCGACRIEIDRGEMARISAAAEDEVLRCPECGAILLRIKP